MNLKKRPSVYILPSYSLTGDLLAFIRCGLQYRYNGIGRLPSARPVQLWFGQFIHGVLEESYRRYDASRQKGTADLPPWPKSRIQEILDLIKSRLRAQGISPWDDEVESLGDARAEAAINELGPELFPLISHAEVRLTGSRRLPNNPILQKVKFRDTDRYEMAGVVDVITHVQLHDKVLQSNRLVQLILKMLPPSPPGSFEVIVDYKGMRRPPMTGKGPKYWEIYGWQVQTYAHLRRAQSGSLPVLAGAILYLNELVPTRGDLEELHAEMAAGTTDVPPAPGSEAEKMLKAWKPKAPLPILPLDYRLRRALRVVAVDEKTVAKSLKEFDDVVTQIEICRGKEIQSGSVLSSWVTNVEESTCTACLARTFCPAYRGQTLPQLPARRAIR